jgi:hypothetical protein
MGLLKSLYCPVPMASGCATQNCRSAAGRWGSYGSRAALPPSAVYYV